MNPKKVKPLKMMFFDCLPLRNRKWFSDTNIEFLKRNKHYRLFSQGLIDYKKEINIVNLLRDLRYYKAAVNRLMKDLPKSVRDAMQEQRSRTVDLL